MSELDKFKGKSLATTSSGAGRPAKVDGVRLPWEAKKPQASKTAEAILQSKLGNFAIALDGTGSMSSLIGMAKVAIKKIMSRVFVEANAPIRVQLFVYRDYDVSQLLVEKSRLSAEANELSGWLSNITATGGGGNDGEAIEQVLLSIQSAGKFDAVLLAGDEPYNSRAYLDALGKKDVPTAVDLARQFGQSQCPLHTFLVGSCPRARKALAELADASGGSTGQLDGSDAMIDMAVLAMLASLKGSAFVQEYMERTPLSHSGRAFGTLLLKGPTT